MVAPLDVECLASEQVVHDDVCSRSAVEDVAQDVELVNAELLDDVADGYDEIAHLTGLYDGLNNAMDVGLLVIVVGAFVQQFLNNIGKSDGQGLADFASRIFAADGLADLYEPQEGVGIIVGKVLVCIGLNHFQTFFRVINEGTEVTYHISRQRFVEKVAHLALDVAAGITQYMEESLVLAVYVGHKVFSAFGQVKDGFEVDDFCAGAFAVGEGLREKL